jgi:hypothetical protein
VYLPAIERVILGYVKSFAKFEERYQSMSGREKTIKRHLSPAELNEVINRAQQTDEA